MLVVLTTLAATLFIQSGYFLWKLSADRQPKIGKVAFRHMMASLLTDWRWVLGLLATIVGWILFVQATALGEISLVQPLMSAGDLLLVLMAVVFLKERLSKKEWLGLALTVIGAAALSWNAETRIAQTSGGLRLAMLMTLLFIAACGLLLARRFFVKTEITLAVVVGLAFGAGAVLTEALTAQSPVITSDILLNPLLIGVIGANAAGLVALQAAFQRGRASVVIPVQLAIANAITVLAGALVFFEDIGLMRGAGISLTIAGTAFLKAGQRKSVEPDERARVQPIRPI